MPLRTAAAAALALLIWSCRVASQFDPIQDGYWRTTGLKWVETDTTDVLQTFSGIYRGIGYRFDVGVQTTFVGLHLEFPILEGSVTPPFGILHVFVADEVDVGPLAEGDDTALTWVEIATVGPRLWDFDPTTPTKLVIPLAPAAVQSVVDAQTTGLLAFKVTFEHTSGGVNWSLFATASEHATDPPTRLFTFPSDTGAKPVAESETEIVNGALIDLGAARILSFDDDSKQARLAKADYAQIRDSVLREHPWNFAERLAELSPDSDTPAFGFDHQFTLPGDCLRVLEVANTHAGDGWRVRGRKLETNQNPACITYTARVTDVAQYDPNFVKALRSALAAAWAEDLVKATNKTELEERRFERRRSKAMSADGQESSPAVLDVTDWSDRAR